jgi:hypothetical protein
MYNLSSGDEHFLSLIELSQDIVGFESVIGVEFFIWHPPPSEIELLPGSDICDLSGKSVVALRSVEILLYELSVVPVGEGTCEEKGGRSSIPDKMSFLPTQTLEYGSAKHICLSL